MSEGIEIFPVYQTGYMIKGFDPTPTDGFYTERDIAQQMSENRHGTATSKDSARVFDKHAIRLPDGRVFLLESEKPITVTSTDRALELIAVKAREKLSEVELRAISAA
jgi:hypothetical protein